MIRVANTDGAPRACEAIRAMVMLDTATLDMAAWATPFANPVANLAADLDEAAVIREIIPGNAPTSLRASPLQAGNGTRIPIPMATPVPIAIALATAIVLIPSG